MRVDNPLRRLLDAIRRASAHRNPQRIELVAWRPLNAGGVMYVADFDGRRHAFVLAPNAACLLSSYVIEGAGAQTCAPTGVRDGSV